MICPNCMEELEIREVEMIPVDEDGNDILNHSSRIVAVCCTQCDWYTCPDWKSDEMPKLQM